MSGLKCLVGGGLMMAAAVLPLRAATATRLATQAPTKAPSRIKLATQAPTGTIWEKELRNLGNTWRVATAGRVTLVVFPDGSQGSESSTVTKMTAGTNQAALLTAGGLSSIDPAFNVFTIPFFFDNDAEEQAVQAKLEPTLEQTLQKKGFHLLCWGTGGWIQIFSKKPLKTLADVKAAKLYVSNDDAPMQQWYTDNGFHPKPLNLADIAPQLKLPNGMIDTTPDTPYLALLTQVYSYANYMLDVHLAPLVGAMVITTTAWNALTPDDQAKMTEAARTMETKIRTDSPNEDKQSIDAMTTHGLQVIRPDAAATAEIRAEATKLGATMRGKMVPADIYDLAAQARDAFRSGRK
jgi:TRAP-type C4-dicarboxylate transport system substrate-binding protein